MVCGIGFGSDPLTKADFDRLSTSIKRVAGIKMPAGKSLMLESRLRRRVRATGNGDLAGYCNWLYAGGNMEEETDQLINAVTTNKTDFFREPRHFDYLAGTLLPQFTAERRGTLRIWSAACSTGVEAYTIAMLLQAYAEDQDGPGYGNRPRQEHELTSPLLFHPS